jgi:hypothetical protein
MGPALGGVTQRTIRSRPNEAGGERFFALFFISDSFHFPRSFQLMKKKGL